MNIELSELSESLRQRRAAALDDAAEAKVKISIEGLDFFYGDNKALHAIDMKVPERKVTAMIGPSGCGKSTLLRVLNRMYDLYPGQKAVGKVLLDGEDILSADVPSAALRRRVGMVFQKPTPFPMSIRDNIAFGIKLGEKVSKSELDDRIEWSLTKAALWNEVKDRLHASAVGLSGGQQQDRKSVV
jgi:phosphate transport system ATP-binding protein